MNTKTRDEFKQDVDNIHEEAEPLRTVNDIIDFYTNRNSHSNNE